MPKMKKTELELRREFTEQMSAALAEALDYTRSKFGVEAATPAVCLDIYNALWTDGESDEAEREIFEQAFESSSEKTPAAVLAQYYAICNESAFDELNVEQPDELTEAIALAAEIFGEENCTKSVIVHVHAETIAAFYNNSAE